MPFHFTKNFLTHSYLAICACAAEAMWVHKCSQLRLHHSIAELEERQVIMQCGWKSEPCMYVDMYVRKLYIGDLAFEIWPPTFVKA